MDPVWVINYLGILLSEFRKYWSEIKGPTLCGPCVICVDPLWSVWGLNYLGILLPEFRKYWSEFKGPTLCGPYVDPLWSVRTLFGLRGPFVAFVGPKFVGDFVIAISKILVRI